eukprot:CAMPEP_0178423144 /NCGR_PEP_ID=MMETSP0689_2-20121128/27538_1 /TAXON_ID=160604 /ORGANISM="Amphidinium massartii, Strain CS-259" /LENGTH=374 /DNA_ID=CAMNT_0020044731 /DNA_START=213 /DNA_END=1337 /DNA_ORIENTATION=-
MCIRLRSGADEHSTFVGVHPRGMRQQQTRTPRGDVSRQADRINDLADHLELLAAQLEEMEEEEVADLLQMAETNGVEQAETNGVEQTETNGAEQEETEEAEEDEEFEDTAEVLETTSEDTQSGSSDSQADGSVSASLVSGADAKSLAFIDQIGLSKAPEELGKGTYLATLSDMENYAALVNKETMAALNVYREYAQELEEELEKQDREISRLQLNLETEQALREKVEAERDRLQTQRSALEVQLVEDDEKLQGATLEVSEYDRQAEVIAERVAQGEVSEEEAALAEDELLKAQEKQEAAEAAKAQVSQELSELKEREAEVERRAKEALEAEAKVREELARVSQQLQTEKERAEQADAKLQKFVDTLKRKRAEGR